MPQKIETGVEPYEVVLGEPKLIVHSPSPLDPETTRGAITLANGFRGSVELSRDGRTAKFLPDEPIRPGAHTLTVSELVSKRGKHLSDRLEIPFVVTDSNAKVRSNLRVENFVRLRVNGTETERLPLDEPVSGKYVEVMKAVDRRTGKPTELAFDERGKPIDHEKLFAKVENSTARCIRRCTRSWSAATAACRSQSGSPLTTNRSPRSGSAARRSAGRARSASTRSTSPR